MDVNLTREQGCCKRLAGWTTTFLLDIELMTRFEWNLFVRCCLLDLLIWRTGLVPVWLLLRWRLCYALGYTCTCTCGSGGVSVVD